MTPEEKNEVLFGSLVMMFHAAGMQQMGKVKNPATDTLERNLEAAQMSIDILDMLQAKTKGNLTAEEEKFLQNMLKELKLNFVDEAAKDKAPGTPS